MTLAKPIGSDDAVAARVLDMATWAVVGLSTSRARPAFGVARFLQSHGKQIIAVHPTAATVHGQPGFASLREIPFPVDVVDVFVNSTHAGAVVDDAIAIGAQAVWLQLGVIDEAAARRAEGAGLDVVMDRCPAIEWPRLGPAA